MVKGSLSMYGGRTPAAPKRSKLAEWLALAAFIGVCHAVGYGSASIVDYDSPWVRALVQPDWAAPDWVFAPVWGALYTLMGAAAWLVWKRRGFGGARAALGLFGLQLVLNGLWTPLFFGLQEPGLALVDAVTLWLAVAATTRAFARHARAAAWLMTPYLAWLTYATVLNLRIWQLN